MSVERWTDDVPGAAGGPCAECGEAGDPVRAVEETRVDYIGLPGDRRTALGLLCRRHRGDPAAIGRVLEGAPSRPLTLSDVQLADRLRDHIRNQS